MTRTSRIVAGLVVAITAIGVCAGDAWAWDLEMAGRLRSLLDGEPDFAAAIVQRDRFFPVSNEEIRLARAPFAIVIAFHGPGDVLMNVNIDPFLYEGVRAGMRIDQILDEPMMFMGMAEGVFNEDRELYVDLAAAHYLYVGGLDDHRFDFVQAFPDAVIGYRSVDRLLGLQGFRDGRSTITPAEIDFPLFLTFLSSTWKNGQRVERQRTAARLVFE